jgi:hypothetical protein
MYRIMNGELVKIPVLDESSRELFASFFHKLQAAHHEFSKLKLTSTPVANAKGSMFDYIPDKIRSLIGNNYKMNMITMKFTHRTINVYISQVENLAKCIYQIYLWFHLADNYADHKCSKNMNVFLYLTNHKKILPVDGSPINQINANTAFTTYCSESTDIHIYRKEEWFKVLIHESFHNMGLEFSPLANDNTNKQILSIFPVKSVVNLGESYAEIWAEMLNCAIVSFITTKSKSNGTLMLSKLEKLLNIETKFSLLQCAKVLRYNNMEYSDFFTSDDTKRRRYAENTNVLSYYIIKTILIYNKNAFIRWCIQNNRNVLDFRKTTTNVDKYCALIKRLHREPTFIANMQTVANIHVGFDDTSLRMTVIET